MRMDERVAGGLWGLLVGDALGVPYEFHPPDDIPSPELIEMVPPSTFPRAHAHVRPGTWSDDGAQALCLLSSLLEQGEMDVEDFGQRLLGWYERGELAVDGEVFDVGIQTAAALRAMQQGVPASMSGSQDERHNGNGSLMRVLPLALWHHGSVERLVKDAHAQSLPTHGHPRSQVCCAYYCLWARGLLHGVEDASRVALEQLRGCYPPDGVHAQELDVVFAPGASWIARGTGYVVDCLRSALQVMEQPAMTFERVVKDAIALGHDTDTTACVAGGVAGIQFGVGSIPERWLRQLRGKEMVEPLLRKLLKRWM